MPVPKGTGSFIQDSQTARQNDKFKKALATTIRVIIVDIVTKCQ